MEKAKAEKTHSHSGHRQRKKDQFLERGLDGVPEHEILEFMLYYSVPRQDTNGFAHELIHKFGSLREVLGADYRELLEVPGIGPNSASMICFFRMLSEIYLKAEYGNKLEVNDSESLNTYCKTLFLNSRVEEIRCIFLDDELKLIGEQKICEGTLGKLELPMRSIIEAVIKAKCNRVVMVHNHPKGSCMPSKPDVDGTREMWHTLGRMEIELVDHVIVGMDGEWSMRFHGTLPDLWGY